MLKESHVNVDKQQTACCISLIAAIGTILITIAYPKPWDALQVSNGAIEMVLVAVHFNWKRKQD